MSRAELIAQTLEAIIDARYYYLKEMDYENSKYANDFKKKHYDPALKVLVELLEKELDNSAE